MSWRTRLTYAFALTTIVCMVLGAVSLLLGLNIVPMLLSGTLVLVVFPLAYVFAPLAHRYVKRSPWGR